MRTFLVAPLAVLLALEIYHCARRNGARFAAKFFGGAIVFGIIRANAVGFVTWAQTSGMPYAVSDPAVRLGFASAVEPFGWAFALYASWFLSEGILTKASGRRAQVFPVAFLSAILMGAFSYAVETAAAPLNWWHWRIANVADPFIYAIPTVGIMDWASVAVDFLMPFLIIECSSWGRSKWSLLLVLVFVAHMVTHLFPVALPRMLLLYDLWHWASIWVLAAAAFVWPLEIAARDGRPISLWGGEGRRALDILPFACVAGMLAIVAYAVLAASGDMKLLFSLLPLASAMLLAAPGVPIVPAALILAAASAVSLRVVPAFLPAAAALLYAWLWQSPGRVLRGITVALIVAGLAAYYPWAWSRTLRVETLQGHLKAMGALWERSDYASVIERSAAANALIAKFAGGEDVTAGMLRAAWHARDRKAFDAAAGELSTFGPQFRDAARLWDVSREAGFDAELKGMRDASRASGRP